MHRPSRVVLPGAESGSHVETAAMWKHCSFPEVRVTSGGPHGGAGGYRISVADPFSVSDRRPHRNSENDRSRRFGLGFGFWARDRSRNLSFSELYAGFRTGKILKIFGAAKIFVRNRASFRRNQRGRTTPGLGGTSAGPCELFGSSA